MTANEKNNHLAVTLELFGACEEAKVWAAGYDSPLAAWSTCPDPHWLLWALAELRILDDRRARLFACDCVRQVWHLLADERSERAVEIAELFTEGEADQEGSTTAAAEAMADAVAFALAAAGAAVGQPSRAAVTMAAAAAATMAAAATAAGSVEVDNVAAEAAAHTVAAAAAEAKAAQCAKIRELWGDDFRTALAKLEI